MKTPRTLVSLLAATSIAATGLVNTGCSKDGKPQFVNAGHNAHQHVTNHFNGPTTVYVEGGTTENYNEGTDTAPEQVCPGGTPCDIHPGGHPGGHTGGVIPTVYRRELLGSGVIIHYTDPKAFSTLEAAIKPILDLQYNQSFLDFIENDREAYHKIPQAIAEFYAQALTNTTKSDYDTQSFANRDFVRLLLERYLTGVQRTGAKRIAKHPSKYWVKNMLGLSTEEVAYAGLSRQLPITPAIASEVFSNAQRDYAATLQEIGVECADPDSSSPDEEPAAQAHPASPHHSSSTACRKPYDPSRSRQHRRQYGDWLGRRQTPHYGTGHGGNFWSPQAVAGRR